MGSNSGFLRSAWTAFLLFFLFSLTAQASLNHLEKITMGYDRLLLHFSQPFSSKNLHTFVLKGKGSFRYVFDFHSMRLGSKHLTDGLHYSSKIRSIRLSQYRRSIVRLVVETPEAYAVAHYPLDERSYTVVLPRGSSSIRGLFATLGVQGTSMLSPRTRTGMSVRGKRVRNVSENKKKSKRVTKSVVKKSRLLNDGKIHLKRRYTVIVDPGHGGHDTGALDPSHRYLEKRAILAIGRRVRNDLKAMGFRVLMTRSSDRFIRLHNRTRYANRKHGDIFVSIHANAVGRLSRAGKVKGVETYYLSPARSSRARRVAAKENSVEFKKHYKDSMNVYLRTLTHSKIILSNKLALDVQRSILSRLRSRYSGVVDGGVRPAPFWVLVGAEMPAILVETGYITHPVE
ncbi:N-acetylmuramoyl-L-alanine amidase, partial [Nitratifractor sp.]|uniref:N-acetylmuramoyl-L-alanine amidase family protein n=1 Tax=Nitratifractor sp. TaxID=2268144 RepID=UPI0025F7885A